MKRSVGWRTLAVIAFVVLTVGIVNGRTGADAGPLYAALAIGTVVVLVLVKVADWYRRVSRDLHLRGVAAKALVKGPKSVGLTEKRGQR